jgi:DNA-binding IclR family transcriptional regulator
MSSTLRKSLRILEAIAKADGPRGISELARELKLDKSAVQRIFQTFVEEGYIEKAPDASRYRPTLRLWELGSRVIAQNETRRLLHPILRYAAKISGLTAYFAAADCPDMIYLDKIEGERGRANSSEPGHRIPMYVAASGHAVLAFLEGAEAKQVLDLAAQRGVSTDVLEQNLEIIRIRLFASTQRGSPAPIGSVAAPVWASGPSPIGAVVLTSDAVTLPPADFERVGAMAVGAAEQATRALGGAFPIAFDNAP